MFESPFSASEVSPSPIAGIITPEGGVASASQARSCSPISVGSVSAFTPSPALDASSSVLAACEFFGDLAQLPVEWEEKVVTSLGSTQPYVPSPARIASSPPAPTEPVATTSPAGSLDGKHNDPTPPPPPPRVPAPPTPPDWYEPTPIDFSVSEDEEIKLPSVSLSLNDCEPDEEGTNLSSLLPDWFLQGSVVVNFEPTKENVTRVMTEIHQQAGFLRGLPPLELWRWAQKKRWQKATRDFVPYFEKAISVNTNSVEFLKLCLRLLELPALALQQAHPEQKGLSQGKEALDAKLRKVESLTLQNRLHAASKVLFSNGIAKASDGLFDRLQKLHPKLKEPIPCLATCENQFSLSPEQTFRKLFKQCNEEWHSPDPYGWNTALLHLVRNVAHPPEQSFFTLLCGLVSKIISADVSDLVAFVLSGGSILGLNKDDDEVQKRRLSQGLDPRERPINQGSLFLKLAFDLALHSKPAQQAAKDLRPIQQGVGAPRGMEMIAHVCSALYSDGYAILKMDATNGFQEIKRSSLHQAVLRRCPSLLSLFQKYYTKESICFFDIESEVRLLQTDEGARIGCKLSSFAFALTVQDSYERVSRELRRAKDGSCIKAATDDVIAISKPKNEADLCAKVLVEL